MNNLKLGVEVTAAHGLVAKDGEGSSNAYVELHFDDQKFRTSIKERDLNPVWNETFYFNISDPNNLSDLTLDAKVYSYNKTTRTKPSLGKVTIHGSSFVPYSDAAEFYYPLEKHNLFSRVKGELGLKVFLTDDPSINPSNPVPDMESFAMSDPLETRLQENEAPPRSSSYSSISTSSSRRRSGSRHTFRHLAKEESETKSQPQPQPQPQSSTTSGAKSEAQPPKFVQFSGPSSQPVDYKLRELSPNLGGGRIVGGRVVRNNYSSVGPFDLVEQMQFLFVRVVKARDLPTMDITGSLDPYVEVKVGNYKGVTKYFDKNSNPEWNEVFAFSRDRLQTSVLEIKVKDKDLIKDDFVGVIRLDLHEVPTRVPPDSPLAPQWYRLEDKKGEKISKGELMLAVWYGTQADEAFPDAWHSDAIAPPDLSAASYALIRSKVYHSPRLWYLRVNVIEAQDLVVSDKGRFPDVYVKAQLGTQVSRTKPAQTRTGNPFWNEDIMFVAAEPFDEHLILTVEDRVGPNKEETLGKVIIPLATIRKRPDDKNFPSQWINLLKPSVADVEEQEKKVKFASKLHARISLDGGYHVLDESTYYSSDLRPSLKQLWKPSIGVLELGILNADGFHPVKTRDGRGTADTFCVAKYGQKWVRTRTIIDSLSPKYNEQYTWEVYDPATVLTIGVFDNGHLDENKDTKIGKVRIRISTLQAGRIYTHSYPLLVLHPSGVKKMGELHLAIRFSCTSMTNLMFLYSKPLLPKMHYSRPLSMTQTNALRANAIIILASRLSRAEPPLKKEVVEYMCDADSHFWSMRRSKANFYRIIALLQGLIAVGKWFGDVCQWKNPVTTVLVHLLFVMLVCFPELILPTVFLYMFLIGLWNYRYRARHPPHMDTRISYADSVTPDELDEEFDTFPTTKSSDALRWRYDRLRSIGAKVQAVLGDIAGQGERAQALLSWRDPRATAIFLTFCLVAAVTLYAIPLQVMALIGGFYIMRHPKFRSNLPSRPVNFFRRLPAKTDYLL